MLSREKKVFLVVLSLIIILLITVVVISTLKKSTQQRDLVAEQADQFDAILSVSNSEDPTAAIDQAIEYAERQDISQTAKINAYITCYLAAKKADIPASQELCYSAALDIANSFDEEEVRSDWIYILESHKDGIPIQDEDSFE